MALLVHALFLGGAGLHAQEPEPGRLVLSAHAHAQTMVWRAYEDLLNHFETRARATLDSILELHPGFGVARVLRAHSGYLASPRLSADERRLEMEAGLSDATRLGNRDRQFAEALAAGSSGEHSRAAELLEDLAVAFPGDPYIALEHAAAIRQLDRDAGRTALQRVQERFPRFAPAHMRLAYASLEDADTVEAIRHARLYVEAAPEQPYSHYVHARVLGAAGRYADAARALTPAMELPRSWFDPVEQVATFHQMGGNGIAARDVLRRYESRPAEAGDRARRARYRAVSFVYDGAVDSARTALLRSALEAKAEAIGVEGSLSLRFLALLYGARLLGDSAAVALTSALQVENSPDTVAHHLFAAQAFALARDTSSALSHFRALSSLIGDTSSQPRQVTQGLIEAVTGNAVAALHTLVGYPAEAGAPFAFIARDIAFEQLGLNRELHEARAAWLKQDANINLRSLPLALARLRAQRRAPMN